MDPVRTFISGDGIIGGGGLRKEEEEGEGEEGE